MQDETLFLVCNYGVLPFWLSLVVAPRTRWTERFVHSGLFVILLVPVYTWALFSDDPGPQGASFFTLEGVQRIFTTPRTVLACWIHYLVFDLFVGAWEARDAERWGVSPLAVAPVVVLTFLFGPIGLLAYLVLRGVMRRRAGLREDGTEA